MSKNCISSCWGDTISFKKKDQQRFGSEGKIGWVENVNQFNGGLKVHVRGSRLQDWIVFVFLSCSGIYECYKSCPFCFGCHWEVVSYCALAGGWFAYPNMWLHVLGWLPAVVSKMKLPCRSTLCQLLSCLKMLDYLPLVCLKQDVARDFT